MKNKVFLVAGLGFGDEGKGSITDYLVRRHNIGLVVRYNGGPQAAHNVVNNEGFHHCFAQFGSGTLNNGVRTFLSHFMLVDPIALTIENNVLRSKGVIDSLERLIIDERCLVVTPIHKLINQMLEISRGKEKYGSCGMGVGETFTDSKKLNSLALTIRDLRSKSLIRLKLNFLQSVKIDQAEQLIDENPKSTKLIQYLDKLKSKDFIDSLIELYFNFVYQKGLTISEKSFLTNEVVKKESIVFEGAQGLLLDPLIGFQPYVTKTRTTFVNAETLLDLAGYSEKLIRIGVLRAYGTRHGRGPFVTEDQSLSSLIPDSHNSYNKWQNLFRVGWFDAVLARYSLEALGRVDQLVITNLDRLKKVIVVKICSGYDYQDKWKYLPVGEKFSYQRIKILNNCIPIYKEIPKWQVNRKRENNLLPSMRGYLNFIEEELNIPINIVSVGPKPNDKIEI